MLKEVCAFSIVRDCPSAHNKQYQSQSHSVQELSAYGATAKIEAIVFNEGEQPKPGRNKMRLQDDTEMIMLDNDMIWDETGDVDHQYPPKTEASGKVVD